MNKYLFTILVLLIIVFGVILFTSTSQSSNTLNGYKFYSNNNTLVVNDKNITIKDIQINGSTYVYVSPSVKQNSSNSVQSDFTEEPYEIGLRFIGNASNFPYYTGVDYNYLAVHITGSYVISGTTYSYNDILPFSLTNNRSEDYIVFDGYTFFDFGVSYNFTIIPTNLIFNSNNNSISTPTTSTVFNPYDYNISSSFFKNGDTNLTFRYNIFSNSNTKDYLITIYSNQTFSLTLNENNITYPFTNKITLLLPNGTYSYKFTYNGNISYKYGSFVVDGKNISFNVQQGFILHKLTYELYFYLIISIVGIILFVRMLGSTLIAYNLVGLAFLYIGYMNNISYFRTNTIMYLAILIIGLLSYKVSQ